MIRRRLSSTSSRLGLDFELGDPSRLPGMDLIIEATDDIIRRTNAALSFDRKHACQIVPAFDVNTVSEVDVCFNMTETAFDVMGYTDRLFWRERSGP